MRRFNVRFNRRNGLLQGILSPLEISGCVLWLRGDKGLTTVDPTLTGASAFDNAAWTKTNVSVVADAVADPDGGTAADQIVESIQATPVVFTVSQTPGDIQAGTATYQVRAKNVDQPWLYIEGNGGTSRVFFNLETGAKGTETSGTGTITAQADGWYLCEMEFTYASGGFVIGLARADNDVDHVVVTQRSVYLYKAEVIQTRVSAWANQADTARIASVSQATAANQPRLGTINGKQALDFISLDYLNGTYSSALAQPATVYLVVETDAGAVQTLMDGTVGTNRLNSSLTATELQMFSGTTLAGGSYTAGTPFIHTAIHNSPNSELYKDGTLVAGPADTGAHNATACRIGVNVTPTQFGVDGRLGEVAIWDRLLSSSEKASLDAYFKGHWGI